MSIVCVCVCVCVCVFDLKGVVLVRDILARLRRCHRPAQLVVLLCTHAHTDTDTKSAHRSALRTRAHTESHAHDRPLPMEGREAREGIQKREAGGMKEKNKKASLFQT